MPFHPLVLSVLLRLLDVQLTPVSLDAAIVAADLRPCFFFLRATLLNLCTHPLMTAFAVAGHAAHA